MPSMSDLKRLLIKVFPDVVAGLILAAILAILGNLYSVLGLWIVPVIMVATGVLAVVARNYASRRRKDKPVRSPTLTPPEPVPLSPQVRPKHGQTILFVDDDVEIIALQFDLLLEREGFEVLAATNVEQAIETLQSDRHLDLIVTDLIMPHGSEKRGESRYGGLEVVEAARQLRPSVPVMCLSVVRNPEIERRLRELGVVDFLHKPILPSVLVELVKLRLPPSQGPSQHEMIQNEIRSRLLQLESSDPYSRIRAIWALGELGQHDPAVLDRLESVAQSDDDEEVRQAARDALRKLQRRSAS